MGSIYELARHTIIFLGEATNGSEAVMGCCVPMAKLPLTSVKDQSYGGMLPNGSPWIPLSTKMKAKAS
jgi:hypothetical protein